MKLKPLESKMPHTIKSSLQSALSQLKKVTATPQLEAEILLSYVLNSPRIKLWTESEQQLTDSQLKQYEDLIQRRAHHEPIAYLIGSREFWTFRLKVTSDTLIPREETELLVRESVARISSTQPASILELGTGSGAIALALASELPLAHILAVDKSESALEVAQYNQQQLKLSNVHFIVSDWFNTIPSQHFDLIVSNPPYIAWGDPHLEASVRDFEPQSAYFADNQGLSDIETIVNQAPAFLKTQGVLLIEHGFAQGAEVRQIFSQRGFQEVLTLQDVNKQDRVTLGTWSS